MTPFRLGVPELGVRVTPELVREGVFTDFASQDTRWIFSETVYEGKKRALHPDLITRVDISLAWIKMEIERLYGAFPAPKLLPVSMNHREEMMSHLAREFAQGKSPMGSAAARR